MSCRSKVRLAPDTGSYKRRKHYEIHQRIVARSRHSGKCRPPRNGARRSGTEGRLLEDLGPDFRQSTQTATAPGRDRHPGRNGTVASNGVETRPSNAGPAELLERGSASLSMECDCHSPGSG